MRIAAITKFKQGDLYEALKKAKMTQTELAHKLRINPTIICSYVNLKAKPTKKRANEIQKILGEAGVYIDVCSIWPERFRGFKETLQLEHIREVPLDYLIEEQKKLTANTQNEVIEKILYNESHDTIMDAIEKALSYREKIVIKLRFGLNEKGKYHTLEEIGRETNQSRERIRQITQKALDRLKEWFNLYDNREKKETINNLIK